MRITVVALALSGMFPAAVVRGQPALQETTDFPGAPAGPVAAHPGSGCFYLAAGNIVSGDVDWVQVTLPVATARVVVDVDFSADSASSVLLASVVGGGSTFNIDDNNAARDDLCGLGSLSTPEGSRLDSAVDLPGLARGATINIGVSGANDFAFTGNHTQSFAYDVWVYVDPAPCTSDADCDDGVPCTVDSCEVSSGLCANAPDNAFCDDGVGCTNDACDPETGCESTPVDANCDDGIDCTVDACDAELDCLFTSDPGRCDDGIACTDDVCDALRGCLFTPNDANCDDGVDCTIDACDAETDCGFVPDDGFCDDGRFCTGVERCEPASGCVAGVDPCPGQFCREADARCVDCLADADCDDGAFCNGAEFCDAAGSCAAGGPPCPVPQTCNEDQDRCESESGLTLDVKPGACPNSLVLTGRGFVSAALVGTSSDDVREIDVGSLRLSRTDGVGTELAPNLAPPGPPPVYEDVATPFPGVPCACHELAGDGIVDLLVRFDGVGLLEALDLGTIRPGSLVEVQISGEFNDGRAFVVTDCLEILKRNKKASDDAEREEKAASRARRATSR